MSELRPRLLWWLHGRDPSAFDLALVYGVGLAVALTVWLGGGSPWLAILCWDVAGGVIANASRATGAFYASRAAVVHVAFVAVHAAHAVAAALLTGAPLPWAGAVFGWMAASVWLVRRVPAERAPAVALALVVLGSAVLPPLPGLAAFVPLYLLKLVQGFGVHARRG